MASSILLALVLLVMLAVLAALERKAGGADAGGLPERAAEALSLSARHSFLDRLDQAVGVQYRVFGKVPVADLAEVGRGVDGSPRPPAFNRVGAGHFDFIVCRASDFAPVCVIELNDGSRAARKEQDGTALKAGVCQATGLPLLSLAERAHSMQDLRERFQVVVSLDAARASTALEDAGRRLRERYRTEGLGAAIRRF